MTNRYSSETCENTDPVYGNMRITQPNLT